MTCPVQADMSEPPLFDIGAPGSRAARGLDMQMLDGRYGGEALRLMVCGLAPSRVEPAPWEADRIQIGEAL